MRWGTTAPFVGTTKAMVAVRSKLEQAAAEFERANPAPPVRFRTRLANAPARLANAPADAEMRLAEAELQGHINGGYQFNEEELADIDGSAQDLQDAESFRSMAIQAAACLAAAGA